MKEINPKHVHKTKMKQCKAARRMKFFKCHFLTSPSPQLTFLLLPNPLTLLVCEKENLISPKKPTVPPPAVSSRPATHMSHWREYTAVLFKSLLVPKSYYTNKLANRMKITFFKNPNIRNVVMCIKYLHKLKKNPQLSRYPQGRYSMPKVHVKKI